MKKDIIRLGQISVRFLLEGAETGGCVSMFEFTVPAGAKVPVPHYHRGFDETAYGLEGVLTFTVGGKTAEIGRGESCFIPRGAVHGFVNLKQEDAKALAVITPALLGPEFFSEMAAMMGKSGPPDVEGMKGIMEKHGLVPVMGGK